MSTTHSIFRSFKIGQSHWISYVRKHINQYQTRFLKFHSPIQKNFSFLKTLKRYGGQLFLRLLGSCGTFVQNYSLFRNSSKLRQCFPGLNKHPGNQITARNSVIPRRERYYTASIFNFLVRCFA